MRNLQSHNTQRQLHRIGMKSAGLVYKDRSLTLLDRRSTIVARTRTTAAAGPPLLWLTEGRSQVHLIYFSQSELVPPFLRVTVEMFLLHQPLKSSKLQYKYSAIFCDFWTCGRRFPKVMADEREACAAGLRELCRFRFWRRFWWF